MRTLGLVGPDYTLHSPEYVRVADLQNTIFFYFAVKGHRPLKGSYTASLQPLKKTPHQCCWHQCWSFIKIMHIDIVNWNNTYLCSAQKCVGGIGFYKHAQQAIQAAKGQKHQCSMDKKISQGLIVSVHSLSHQQPPPSLIFQDSVKSKWGNRSFSSLNCQNVFKRFLIVPKIPWKGKCDSWCPAELPA